MATQETVELDEIAAAAIVDLLLGADRGSSIRAIAEEHGVELTDGEIAELELHTLRILDSLAIPFLESLPETLTAEPRRLIRAHSRAKVRSANRSR